MKNLYTALILTFAATTLPLLSHAENSNSSHQTQLQNTELQNIDQEIQSLEEKLSIMRKKQISGEIHAQPYMIDNWHEFAEDIQATENSEKAILAIKKKIEELKERKESLQPSASK